MIVSLDTETTGPLPHDRVIQIGIVAPNGGLPVVSDLIADSWQGAALALSITERAASLHQRAEAGSRLLAITTETQFATLINPQIHIPAEATAVHGIGDEDVRLAPTFAMVARTLVRMLEGADICAYNARFDLTILQNEFMRVRQLCPRWRHIIDPYRIYRHFHPHTLSAAVQHYLHKEHADAHGALPDAQAAYDVLQAQIQQHLLPTDPKELAAHLAAITRRPDFVDDEGKIVWRDGVACLNFGAHIGKPIHRVPPGYLEWMDSHFSHTVKVCVRHGLRGPVTPELLAAPPAPEGL